MAIFSRRVLQHIVNENAVFLTKGQIAQHVAQLNKLEDEDYLAHEWEIVMLNALSKIGKVTHERTFPSGTSKADVYFESPEDGSFVADIRTVSDKGLHKKNPFDPLFREVLRKATSRGLRGNSFGLEVKGEKEGIGENKRGKLRIPGTSRFEQIIFKKGFDDFLDRIVEKPDELSTYSIKEMEHDLRVIYNPKQKYAWGNHLSYTVIYSPTKNHVYDALVDKRKQLLATGFTGLKGIFLCDGDCNLVHSGGGSCDAVSLEQVVRQFLTEDTSVDFIMVFAITSAIGSPSVESTVNIVPCLYHKEQADANKEKLIRLVGRLSLPKPEATPGNALSFLKRKAHGGRSHAGGWRMDSKSVKISSRTLLDLLSGRMDQSTFLKIHGFVSENVTGSDTLNPFLRAIKSGQMIDEIAVEKSRTDDDDWIKFKFKMDVAVSPFVSPKE